MFGFGDSRYKEEARVTVETCISCARQMDGLFLIDTPELQKIGETVPGFQTEMWVKLLASAQLTHNLMVIMMLVRIGTVKTSMKEFQKTAVCVDQYVNAHPFFGKRLSDLMIELTNQIYSPQNQGIFPRYGWGRWAINLSKREKTGHPSDLNELLTFDEAKLADKIDHQITTAMMAECGPIYSACIKPASLPVKQTVEAQRLSRESQPHMEAAAKADHARFEDNKAKAEKGDAQAQFNLGYSYKYIQGGPKDAVEAVKWFRKAAEQNHAHAQYSLGCCYEHGAGVSEDFIEACKWFNLSLANGYINAIPNLDFLAYRLGCRYRDGNGVQRNAVEAYKWFDVASIRGSEDAITNRDAVAALMTQGQIAEAQRLSSEFKPH